MKKLLFINGCPRGEGVSRTLSLAEAFIEEYVKNHEDISVNELRLFDEVRKGYGMADIEERDRLLSEGRLDAPMFDRAREFAGADVIVMAAPYWDLSFPAAVKAYIEEICAVGITFHYTEHGAEGLSAFEKMFYITTAGGYFNDYDLGFQYVKAVSGLLGCGDCIQISAEGLDMEGCDVSDIMEEAIENARALAG